MPIRNPEFVILNRFPHNLSTRRSSNRAARAPGRRTARGPGPMAGRRPRGPSRPAAAGDPATRAGVDDVHDGPSSGREKGAFVATSERTYLPPTRFAMKNHTHTRIFFLVVDNERLR